MPRIITLTPNPTFDFAVDADFVKPNRKLRCKNPVHHPGGGGVNVARATTRLGAETLAIFTAGGLYGDALKAAMEEEGVKMRAVPVQGATRLAFHVMELAKGDEYRFNLPGAQMSAEEARSLLDAMAEETAPGDYVVGSGSLPPGAGDDFWARAARIAKDHEAKFVLDSIHGLEAALAEGVFLLRQNQHEYTALAGNARPWPEGVAAFAEEIVEKGGAARMVITHGGDGSAMASRGAPTVTTPALEVRAHSAVGAGDSFVGGLIAAFLRGEDDQTALRYGAACAAATRMSPGKSLFDPKDVKTLFGA